MPLEGIVFLLMKAYPGNKCALTPEVNQLLTLAWRSPFGWAAAVCEVARSLHPFLRAFLVDNTARSAGDKG